MGLVLFFTKGNYKKKSPAIEIEAHSNKTGSLGWHICTGLTFEIR